MAETGEASLTVRRIITSFIDCKTECGRSDFHRSMITLLIECGGVFYQSAPYPPPICEKPHSMIEENGDLYASINFSQELLNADSEEASVQRGFLGMYANAACRKSFSVDSRGWRDDAEGFDHDIQQLADGRVVFMRFLRD